MRTEIELRVADVVFSRDGDVRELFFSRNSFVNAELANLYGISPDGVSPILYVPVELPPERAGLLTSGAFLAMNAHPSETSPTLRGKYVRERVLCQEVQPPPDDVDTDIPPPMETGPQTLRERLVEHRNNPACSICHAFIDPPGFLFEHYDSVGAWRDREPNGVIDASGGLDDIELDGAADLAIVLRDDPRVPRCIIKQLYRHTMGRLDEEIEAEALYELIEIASLFEELVVDLEMARALSGAVNELVDYARADVRDNILDSESEALVVSKRVVRELFEQKLQCELDRHDEASARRPIPCSKCDRAA